MKATAKTIVLAFSLVSLLASPIAEAARMGHSRSAGMRRSAPVRSQNTTQPPVQAPVPMQSAVQPQRSGPGVGTAVAAGVAGAAVGYMAGSAMSHPSQAAPAQPQVAQVASAPAATEPAPGPAIPWRLISVLALAFVVGLWLFRRRVGMPNGNPAPLPPSQPQQNTFDNSPPPAGGRFDPIPPIGSAIPGQASPMQTGNTFTLQRLPDGTETPYFLRQAKATFQHLQSLNSPDTLDEVRRYMTPELFEELRGEIGSNGEFADFPRLDCQLIDATEENGRYIASVRFTGLVSESVNAAPVPFGETWHFVKTAGQAGKWIVAGIQHED